MDTKYIMEIPKQLREMFKNKKSNDYTKKIVANIPLQEQNLNHHTLEILAVLNYNYWCKDEKKKKELFNRLFIHLASSSVCWDLFCIIYFIYLLFELF